VHLDARDRLLLGVGVAAEVGPTLENQDPQAQLRGASLGDGEPEEPTADHEQIREGGTRRLLTGRGLVGHVGDLLDCSPGLFAEW
jgi:hypothetical protein